MRAGTVCIDLQQNLTGFPVLDLDHPLAPAEMGAREGNEDQKA